MRRRLAALVGVALPLAVSLPARAVDVSQLSSVEQDPCFQQAHQRALDHQLGVIESQIVAACADAHGNPTDAMALLTERAKAPPWLPPASGRMSATDVLLVALAELAVLSILLGVDVGYAGRALALPVAKAPFALAILAARAVVAVLLTAIAAIPGGTIVISIGLLAFAIRVCRWRAPVPAAAAAAAAATESAVGPIARAMALIATDLLGNVAVILGIAAVARGSLLLSVVGVLAAALAARLLHPSLGRLLLRNRFGARVAGAMIAAIAGIAAIADSGLANLAPASAIVAALVPVCCVLFVVIVEWRLRLSSPLGGEAAAMPPPAS